jgi:hypothetical protein
VHRWNRPRWSRKGKGGRHKPRRSATRKGSTQRHTMMMYSRPRYPCTLISGSSVTSGLSNAGHNEREHTGSAFVLVAPPTRVKVHVHVPRKPHPAGCRCLNQGLVIRAAEMQDSVGTSELKPAWTHLQGHFGARILSVIERIRPARSHLMHGVSGKQLFRCRIVPHDLAIVNSRWDRSKMLLAPGLALPSTDTWLFPCSVGRSCC